MAESGGTVHKTPPQTGGVRLQRVLADAGVAARRVCEQLIEAGRVEVNGQVVTRLPIFVDPENDRISVDGRLVRAPQRHLYVMLHKPTRTLSTASDEPGADRRTVAHLVNHPSGSRLYPVGRLEYDTTGLILLTNDGELANRLSHPRYGLPQVYQAVVRGEPDEATLTDLQGSASRAQLRRQQQEGKPVGEARGSRIQMRTVKRGQGRSLVEITLLEGPNREVATVLSRLGFHVKKLTRIAVGPLRLSGVALGEWRELERDEIHALRRAAFGRGPKGLPEPSQPYRTSGPAPTPPPSPSPVDSHPDAPGPGSGGHRRSRRVTPASERTPANFERGRRGRPARDGRGSETSRRGKTPRNDGRDGPSEGARGNARGGSRNGQRQGKGQSSGGGSGGERRSRGRGRRAPR